MEQLEKEMPTLRNERARACHFVCICGSGKLQQSQL